MKIINVALPTSTQFGTFQVEGMESTFFRFNDQSGFPVLDQFFFIESEPNPDKRERSMSAAMYLDLQAKIEDELATQK
ncbi:hypothetical protein [Lacticaseibacillus sharpeae]|uniref:hypothetical protein n=1 Tax=Lacticaseibacillus sharpeae TaxID=1626 RepID=UPI0006D1F5EE|nr:hypothetical protein [Lacticaseibacillus sharpeae]